MNKIMIVAFAAWLTSTAGAFAACGQDEIVKRMHAIAQASREVGERDPNRFDAIKPKLEEAVKQMTAAARAGTFKTDDLCRYYDALLVELKK